MPKKITRTHKPQLKIVHTARVKPEFVYKVKNKIVTKAVLPKNRKKKNKFSVKKILNKKITRQTAMIMIAVAIVIFGFIVFTAGRIAYEDSQEAQRASRVDGIDEDSKRALFLIGDGSNYQHEIANYASAPESLQAFITKDYRNMKAKCIVNGEFITPIGYEIVNVVYDSYAKINRTCGGSETVLLQYISGNWTVIHAGNDLVRCDIVNAFRIPQGVSAKCMVGNVQYVNPNP